MEINVVSVQYNGGLLPDIILLTRCGYIGEPVRYHEEVLSLQPMFPPKPSDIFSPKGGCSEGLGTLRFFLWLHYTRLVPDPRFLLFVLQNIAGYKNNAVECLLQ